MLFNSFIFIFGFLPVALIGVYGVGRISQSAAKLALLLFSLAFYAYWRSDQLPLLLFSIGFNFIIGGAIRRAQSESRTGRVRLFLIGGILVDLAMLGWFKYANFVVDNLNIVFNTNVHLKHIALPLAISFFTFQKLAYLIDSARGETDRINLLDFSLFAAFFPQLIAGPIVHFKEIIPQLRRRVFGRFDGRNLMVGLVLFAIGLFKKTVIADTLSSYANPLFQSVAQGHHLGFATSWLAALSFTFQLYFDFSGYSDMAIGLGRMLGVKLPLNFHSPLRASNIVDYWRRWHMTLQRFIVAYIFQPLSLPLNRAAAEWGLRGWGNFAVSSGVPILVTFVAVGIWHGAGWTYVLFGLIHAIYICINEIGRERDKQLRRKLKRAGLPPPVRGPAKVAADHILTLLAVIYANVLFKSPSLEVATTLWSGMTGLQGMGAMGAPTLDWGLWAALAVSAFIVFLMPNSQQIMGRFDPAYNWREWRDTAPAPFQWSWRPDVKGLAFAGATLFFGVMFIQRGQAIFLYFNF